MQIRVSPGFEKRSFLNLNNPKEINHSIWWQVFVWDCSWFPFFSVKMTKITTWQVLELRGTQEICWTESIPNYLMLVLIAVNLARDLVGSQWGDGGKVNKSFKIMKLSTQTCLPAKMAEHISLKYSFPLVKWRRFLLYHPKKESFSWNIVIDTKSQGQTRRKTLFPPALTTSTQ